MKRLLKLLLILKNLEKGVYYAALVNTDGSGHFEKGLGGIHFLKMFRNMKHARKIVIEEIVKKYMQS